MPATRKAPFKILGAKTAATAALLLIAGCASGPKGPPDGPGGSPPGGFGGGPQAFVSPFGEPFLSQPGEPYPVAAWFAGADTDHDGALTFAEFAADGQRWFTALDLDGDGEIGPDEIAIYEARTTQALSGVGMGGMGGPGGGRRGPPGGGAQGGGARGGPPGGGMSLGEGGAQDGGMGQMGGQMGGPGGQDGGPGGGGGRTRSGPYRAPSSVLAMAGLLNSPQPVKAADTNTNQRITPQEWTAAAQRWFQLLDADKDGRLTLETLPKTPLQQGGEHGGGGGRPPRR